MAADREYYRRRLEEERRNAATADRADVRSVHEKLVALYEERISAIDGRPPHGAPIRDCSPETQTPAPAVHDQQTCLH